MFTLAALQADALAAAKEEVRNGTESKLEVGPVWKFKTDPDNVGVKENWFATATDDKGWVSIRGDRPGWNAQGFPRYIGYGWYRTRVKVPKTLDSRKNLLLVFGAVDEDAVVYINGKKAFEHTCTSAGLCPEEIWDTPFVLKARRYLKLNEENLIAVRVYSRAMMGGIWKPVYLISTDGEEPTSVYQEGLKRSKMTRMPMVAIADVLGPRKETGFRVPPGERQLFLDDHGLAEMNDLKRTMHRPAKKGAVIRPNTALGVESVQIRMAPIWSPEKKVWQLWDCAATPPGLSATGRGGSGYYESTDGLHWSKPAVGQLKYDGWPENNYVFAIFQGQTCRTDCVVYDAASPDPLQRYKTVSPSVFSPGRGGFAASPDGIHWTEVSSPGIFSADEWNLTLDEKEHLFLHYVKRSSKHGRAIWLSVSKDFRTWSIPELIFQADDLDQELGIRRIKARIADPTMQKHVYNDPNDYNVDVYHMSPFRYESRYLGTPAMYHSTGQNTVNNTDGFHVIELASSRNLRNWTRQGDRKAFIPPSPIGGGAYDTVQLLGPASAVVRGDELWLYYTGLSSRGPEYKQRGGAICLAVLRRDGFVSLDAGETEGTVLTNPFTPPDGKLFVNVDAFKGELRIEALDTNGEVLAASAPIKGDLLRGKVEWQEGDITDLKGKAVSLRFTLRNASLYSYWLQQEE